MNKLTFELTGLRPLIMNNGAQADPKNPGVVAMKALRPKRSTDMTEALREELEEMEWRLSTYWDESRKEFVIPSDNIESMIVAAAKKKRLGPVAKLLIVEPFDGAPVTHALSGKGLKALYADPRYRFRRGVKIDRKTVFKVRSSIPAGWVLTFSIHFDESATDPATVRGIVAQLPMVGLGDWRPKYGIFTVREV
jgi:hypothetical protein